VGGAVWLAEDQCDLEDFLAVIDRPTDLSDFPHAESVVQKVLVYDSARLRNVAATTDGRQALQAELARALLHGPGLVVFSGAFADLSVVDRATDAFNELIAEQRDGASAAGDHFAKPGANDRVWNALEKLAVREPGVFADYYANDVIALASWAWLGPSYQITSQVNVVNPGGEAQTPHCDYHLGFLSNAQAEQYPAHVHRLSAVLTLQGAVAHCDMPVESGPTKYLPYSHAYRLAYLGWRRPELRAHFEASYVQLPLAKGDAVFFNPALFHAAGANRSPDLKRMANLLQISSAFGRAMESVDRGRMVNAVFPVLLERRAAGVGERELRNAIAACAEGYAFPTNLDRDQPVEGLAPESQAELTWRAVEHRWDPAALRKELDAQSRRRETHEG
jgi:ectoine hydroxylase-related dioxygenase (phytanoyl-CoA dioxygenase family)